MEIFEYEDKIKNEWNDFCLNSPDSWFWYTRWFCDFIKGIHGDSLIKDESFTVINRNKIVAVIPVMCVRNSNTVNLIFGDQPLPWPLFSSLLSAKELKNIKALVFENYRKIALTYDADFIDTYGTTLSETMYLNKNIIVDPTLPFGYVGRSHHTCSIYLTPDKKVLWGSVRKGHKSSIKSFNKFFEVKTWCNEITGEEFEEYRKLHALAAGRTTRPSLTFDMMKSWIETGNGLLIGASRDGVFCGFIYIIIYKKAAYYASAANHPDMEDSFGVGHGLIWEAINQCKDKGLHILEMGKQYYGTSDDDSDKEINISNFKRGFGGNLITRYESTLKLR